LSLFPGNKKFAIPANKYDEMRYFSFAFRRLFCLTLVLLASMKLAKSDVMSKLKQEIKFSAHTASRKCHRENKFGRWPICSRSISYVEHHILWSKSHSANCFRSLTMQCGWYWLSKACVLKDAVMRQQEAKSHKLKNEVEGLLTSGIKVKNGMSLFMKYFVVTQPKSLELRWNLTAP